MTSNQLLFKIILTLSVPAADSGKQQASADEFRVRLIDHHRYLLALLRYKTGDYSLAEDLLQETYLAFLRTNPDPQRFATDAKLKNYLTTIALNCLRSYFRRETGGKIKKNAFRTTEELDDWVENLPSPHVEAEAKIIASDEKMMMEAAVALAMERIGERQRSILELKFTKGLENPEIGAALGLGIKAVESLLFRAKAQFKKEFEKIALSENVYGSAAVNTKGNTGHEA